LARAAQEEAKDPQMILGDALKRFADEADVSRLEVGEAVEIIEDFAARRVGGQGVDGEIAPRRILAPILGEGDRGAAAIGRDVAAQGGDLDRRAGEHRGDRAVGDSGRHRLDPSRLEPLHDLLGRKPRGEIDIADLEAQQRVAHAAADETGRARAGAERVEQAVHAWAASPGGGSN